MAEIIAIHSFRGGTGKSNLTGNLAVLLAGSGMRVGIVDTDVQSPGVHVLFGISEKDVTNSLNDYLAGRCEIDQAAYDVTSRVDPDLGGAIILVPSATDPNEIARVAQRGYDPEVLVNGLRSLISQRGLDFLIIDTHPGLNQETLLSIAISTQMLIVLRPDMQDYEGTDITLRVARLLEVPRLMLVANKVPNVFDLDEFQQQLEETFQCQVAAVLPHSDEMMILGSDGFFALKYPDHPMTARLQALAAKLQS